MSHEIIDPRFELVIEISSFCYSDRESPLMGTNGVSDEDFQQYLDDCLLDAGLDHLRPIAPKSWFYATSQIDRKALAVLVAEHLSDCSDDEDYSILENVNEYVGSFSGGIAILQNGELISRPGCCCGLDTLREWKSLLETKPGDWTDLWVGHDTDLIESKFDRDQESFNFRLGKWQTGQWDRQFTLSVTSLEVVIASLHQSAPQFSQMIEQVLDSKYTDPECRQAMAQRMAGLS